MMTSHFYRRGKMFTLCQHPTYSPHRRTWRHLASRERVARRPPRPRAELPSLNCPFCPYRWRCPNSCSRTRMPAPRRPSLASRGCPPRPLHRGCPQAALAGLQAWGVLEGRLLSSHSSLLVSEVLQKYLLYLELFLDKKSPFSTSLASGRARVAGKISQGTT